MGGPPSSSQDHIWKTPTEKSWALVITDKMSRLSGTFCYVEKPVGVVGGVGGGGRSGVLLLHQLVGLCVIKMHEQSDWFKSMATPFHKSAQIKSTMSTM